MKILKKRRVASKTPFDCDNYQEQQSFSRHLSCKKSSKKNKMNKDADEDLKNLFSPTFNIHIHIPPIDETNGSKINIPKIQPVFHLHLDELAKRIKIRDDSRSKESLYKAFKNVFRMTSPKFGDVKFHVKSKSKKRSSKVSDVNCETPLTTRTYSDSQISRKKAKENIVSGDSDNSQNNHDNNDDKNISNANSEFNYNSATVLKNLKLKNPVVELTDICKSKYWNEAMNRMIREPQTSENENKSSECSPDQVDNNDVEKEKCENLVKLEKVASPSFSSSVGNSNENIESHSNFETNINEVKSEKITTSTPNSQESVKKDESFNALAPEFNFSEILNRFRCNSVEKLANTEKCSKDSECEDKNFFVDNRDSKISEENFEDELNDTVLYTGVNKIETENCGYEINEGSINFDDEFIETPTHREVNKIISDSNNDDADKPSPSLLQFAEGGCNLSTSKFNDLNQIEQYDEGVENKNYIKFIGKHCYDSDSSELDEYDNECNISSDSVEVIEDSSTLANRETGTDRQVGYKVPEIKYELYNVGDIDLHLKLIEKEMKRRFQLNKNNSKQSKTSKKPRKSEVEVISVKKSTSPNKIKHTKNNSEKKKLKSFPTEDYIPLTSSGSTNFAVAPLDKLNPYKTHSARNFKEEMLYGNRVKRYSSPEKLRMFQLKREAVRNSGFKQEKV